MHTRQPYRKVRVQSGCDGSMRDPHFVCGGLDDVASMGLLENWIDEAERRVRFLFECGRKG